jgi:hypothetical protein
MGPAFIGGCFILDDLHVKAKITQLLDSELLDG